MDVWMDKNIRATVSSRNCIWEAISGVSTAYNLSLCLICSRCSLTASSFSHTTRSRLLACAAAALFVGLTPVSPLPIFYNPCYQTALLMPSVFYQCQNNYLLLPLNLKLNLLVSISYQDLKGKVE